MKFTCLFVVLVDVVVVAALIVRSRETYLFAQISRFTRLGPEGELSQVEVQRILQQSTERAMVIPSTQNDTSAPLETIPHPLPNRSGPALIPTGRFTNRLLMEDAAPAATSLSITAPAQNFAKQWINVSFVNDNKSGSLLYGPRWTSVRRTPTSACA